MFVRYWLIYTGNMGNVLCVFNLPVVYLVGVSFSSAISQEISSSLKVKISKWLY